MGESWRDRLQRSWWTPKPTPLSIALAPLAGLYRLAWRGRRLALRLGWLRPAILPVPIVVVGNLIVGGAGKTPTVIALVHRLQALGWTVGVISRGHGRSGEAPRAVLEDTPAVLAGDEPLLIRRRTGVPVWVGRDRPAAARALRDAHPDVDLIVSDDGLQHRRLPRAAQLIVFDERGVGNGQVLPAGPLREPWPGRVPPRSVVLYNAPQPSTPWPGPVASRQLGRFLPLAAWWHGDDAESLAPQELRGRPLIAAAGMASPQRFFDALAGCGLAFEPLPLPDHAPLTPRPWPDDGRTVLVTEKDAVKLDPQAADAGRVVVVTLDFRIPDATVEALRTFLPTPTRRAALPSQPRA